MIESLDALATRRAALLQQIGQLSDFRPGSITPTSGRCGNPNCHCHQPGQPLHGPRFRLTFRHQGKTVTESFPSEAARRKTQHEIDEYRKWQQLSREFVELNTRVCQRRPVEETLTPQGKKRRSDPPGGRPRSESAARGHLRRAAPQRSLRSRSRRDGHSQRDASRRSSRVERVVVLLGGGAAPAALHLRPTSWLS